MTIPVYQLGSNRKYLFVARTPYEALQKMRYTLDVAKVDKSATINKTESGRYLYLDHFGETYCVAL